MHKTAKRQSAFLGMVQRLAAASACGGLAFGLVLVIAAAILSRKCLSFGMIAFSAAAALGVGGFVGAYAFARMQKSNGLICGLVSFAVYEAVILPASLILHSASLETAAGHVALQSVVLCLFCLVGGISGVSRAYAIQHNPHRRSN